MTLHRITFTAAVMAAFATSASAVSPSPPEQPTAGGQGDRSTEQSAPRLTPDVTPGWSLMTPQERQQLQQNVQSAKSHDECRAVMDQNSQKMADRANARGITTPGTPRRDVCAGM